MIVLVEYETQDGRTVREILPGPPPQYTGSIERYIGGYKILKVVPKNKEPLLYLLYEGL